MIDKFGIDKRCIEIGNKVEKELEDRFRDIDKIAEYNQYKVLKSMQDNRLTDSHFHWHTGYGYGDAGRETLEAIYADVFHTEDALVRTQIVNGTHALTLSLTGILRRGDELLSITGKPYDTLEEVIGISGDSDQSLKAWGIEYKQVERLSNGAFDFENIASMINKNTKMVYIQRSVGYSWQSAVTIESIKKPTILIMGGMEKGSDFKELTDIIKKKVERVLLFGECKKRIEKTFLEQGMTNYQMCDNLDEAFELALQSANNGYDILLSPACASWDMYESFEKRGDHFRELYGRI